MEETLGAALAALFKGTAAPAPGAPSAASADQRAREALDHYNRAIERLKAGDWSAFGTQLDALKPLLEQMSH
jgi:uncharacterized membrane protein (UPF0182 family)